MERLGDAVARVLGRLEAQLREEKPSEVVRLAGKVRRDMATAPGGGGKFAHDSLTSAKPRNAAIGRKGMVRIR